VTLAHEFCHLLVDRGHALSAVDVLGGRMPNAVEARAKAFAGELLLPRRVAGDIWVSAGRPRGQDELSALLKRLTDRYRVTRSVATWKLEHGARDYDVDLGYMLDLIVPNR
jgi:Zn-dependent peptidase ImmA (M78 family)